MNGTPARSGAVVSLVALAGLAAVAIMGPDPLPAAARPGRTTLARPAYVTRALDQLERISAEGQRRVLRPGSGRVAEAAMRTTTGRYWLLAAVAIACWTAGEITDVVVRAAPASA